MITRTAVCYEDLPLINVIEFYSLDRISRPKDEGLIFFADFVTA